MTLPEMVSREAWTAARRALLTAEKAALPAKDELNTRRRELPMVRVEKDYRFVGPEPPRGRGDKPAIPSFN